jgi:hypothetical protein
MISLINDLAESQQKKASNGIIIPHFSQITVGFTPSVSEFLVMKSLESPSRIRLIFREFPIGTTTTKHISQQIQIPSGKLT